MKHLLAAAAFAATSFQALATELPFNGSTVMVPPLLTPTGALAPPQYMRFPIRAGVIDRAVTTMFPGKVGKAIIVRGHLYFSLCTPNQLKMACAPLVRTTLMKDIDVGAFVDKDGVSLLDFKVNPASARTPQEIAYSISHFKTRFDVVGQHFDNMVAQYAPRPNPRTPPGKHLPVDPKLGTIKSMTEVEVEPCVFHDDGSYDCTGGSSGGIGSPWEEGWPSDGGGSPSSYIPTYPSGNNNGDIDPCMVNGTNICQQVVVTATRPNMTNCQFSLFGWRCQTTRSPVPLDPYEALPPGTTRPWFGQSTCNYVHFLCTNGQEPETDIPEEEVAPAADAEWLEVVAWATACVARSQAKAAMCVALAPYTGAEKAIVCTSQAYLDGRFCIDELNRRRNE